MDRLLCCPLFPPIPALKIHTLQYVSLADLTEGTQNPEEFYRFLRYADDSFLLEGSDYHICRFEDFVDCFFRLPILTAGNDFHDQFLSLNEKYEPSDCFERYLDVLRYLNDGDLNFNPEQEWETLRHNVHKAFTLIAAEGLKPHQLWVDLLDSSNGFSPPLPNRFDNHED